MQTNRKLAIPLVLLIALALSGCAAKSGTTAPPVPEPFNVRVARFAQAGLVADKTAMDTLKVLWQNGKLDAATTDQVKAYLLTMGTLFDDATTESQSTDSATTMKVNLGVIVAKAGVAVAVKDPELQGYLTAILNAFQGIKGAIQ